MNKLRMSLRSESWSICQSPNKLSQWHNPLIYYAQASLCFSHDALPVSSQSQVMSSPFVLIDDTNSSIHYSGPWFEVENAQTDTGSYGRPFQDTLHGVNVTAYFSFPFSGILITLLIWFEPSHSIIVFRIGCPCLRDKHNNKCFWNPRSNLGVFYRQYQHRLVPCAADKWKQLDSLWQWSGSVSRWIPYNHRESKCFESANILVRSYSVCSISWRLNKSITSAYRFKRLSHSV